MKKLNLLAALALAMLAAQVPSAQKRDRQPIIRATVDVVNVLCTVRDRGGKGSYIEGLKKDNFEIYEDGARQTIRYFNHGMGEEAEPLSIVLLIDTSGSVKGRLAFEQKAAVEFLNATLRKNKDLASVVQFDEEMKLLQDFTYDEDLLQEAIMGARAGGGTKLYEAVWLAAEDLLSKEVGRRVVVVLSDGDDTLSQLSKNDAVQVAQEHDIVIFGIGIKSADTNYGALKDFAQETGGLFVDSDLDLDKLRHAFARINGEIKNQYSLGYVSTNPTRDGSFREIRIKVNKRGLKVKHRKGYYAPKADHEA